MRTRPFGSWSMRISRWTQQHDWPLWIRSAERIDVPAGGVVPGPLDSGPLPAPTLASAAPLPESWLGWWRACRPADPNRPVPLRGTRTARLRRSGRLAGDARDRRAALVEAEDWHRTRSQAGMLAHPPGTADQSTLVGEIERSIGRWPAPFELEFILLPVRDDKVRADRRDPAPVTEHLYGIPAWRDWLRPVVTRLAAGS